MNLNTCVEVFSLYAPPPPKDWNSDEWILANRLTKYLVIIVGLSLMLIQSLKISSVSRRNTTNQYHVIQCVYLGMHLKQQVKVLQVK